MIAKPSQKSREDYNTEATQWFIVSDLGLTAFSGDDGVHAFVRSLADTNRSAGVNVRLIARNNEVLGTAKTDARRPRQVRRRPGARRRRPAAGHCWWPKAPAATTPSSTSPRAAFDLTDRGVKGRASPGPLDVFVYTERGVYRPGETVHITALRARCRTARPRPLPVTLIVDAARTASSTRATR